MGSDSALIEIIILAVVAGFLILRLRSVLGKRHGQERPRYEDADRYVGGKPEKDEGEAGGNVTPFPGRPGVDAEPPPTFGPAGKVVALDPTFDEEVFVSGAREAFRMILSAYAGSDRDTLKALASPEVYEALEGAISDRESRDETLDATLISIRQAKIDSVDTSGTLAQVTVQFESEQSNVTRNADGQPIDGAPDQVETIVDLWTFERDMAIDDPNWRLVETQPGD